MKMRLLLTFLALIMALTMMTACGNTPTTTSDNGDTVQTTQTSADTATTTTAPMITTTPPSDTILFESETLPFSLTLPSSWDGAYTVRESETSVIFYELQNHLENSQGRLFTIRFIAEESYEDDMFPDFTALGQHGGYYVVVLYPTDVQYIDSLSEPYQRMQADIETVLSTFKYTD